MKINKWRFSDNKYLKFISLCLCYWGYHKWLWYDGRPLNCMCCGIIGHTLAYNKASEDFKLFFDIIDNENKLKNNTLAK